MKATQTNNTLLISQILREEYSDKRDLGHVNEFIQANSRTADFELSEGFKMRCYESKQGVYYNVFRAK